MPNADYFAEKAARCRELVGCAINKEVAEQLRVWADEFELMAEAFSLSPIGRAHPSRRSADDRVASDLAGDLDGTSVDRRHDIPEKPLPLLDPCRYCPAAVREPLKPNPAVAGRSALGRGPRRRDFGMARHGGFCRWRACRAARRWRGRDKGDRVALQDAPGEQFACCCRTATKTAQTERRKTEKRAYAQHRPRVPHRGAASEIETANPTSLALPWRPVIPS